MPRGLRAPELVLTGAVNDTLDVWSFGCLVFELLTGQQLFCVPWYPSECDEEDDHLLEFNACLGPFPDELYKHWKRSSFYFTPDRKLFNCELGGIGEGKEPYMPEQKSMEKLFDEAAPEISTGEARMVKALIRRILRYDPAKRPSAAEILRDPWFCEDEVAPK